MTQPLPDRALLAALELGIVLTAGSACAALLWLTAAMLWLLAATNAWGLVLFAGALFSAATWLELALCRWYPHWRALLALEVVIAFFWLLWLSDHFNTIR
jgi:hypothetical protein